MSRDSSSEDEDEKRPLLSGEYLKSFASKGYKKSVNNRFFSALKKLWRTDWFPCIPARYVLAIITFFGFVNVFTLRVNLSIGIVGMVNNSVNSSLNDQFNWTSTQQGWILSAFFYGYVITQVPGGWLAGKYGGRIVFGVGVVMTAVLSLFTPLAARIDYRALIALRALEGFFEGVTFPAMHTMWGKWAPPAERSILSQISYAGIVVGTVISFPLSALLCVYGFNGGWPSIFYVFGTLGTIWFLFWLLLGFDSPSTHPRISKEEREYIESSIAAANILNEDDKETPTPWFQMFISPAVWAIMIAFFAHMWGSYTLLTCMPSYFHDALGLTLNKDIIQNGIYSGLPFVGYSLTTLLGGIVADLLRKHCLSTTIVRKMMGGVGLTFAAVGLLVTAYLGEKKLDSVIYLCIAVASLGIGLGGYLVNIIDIAPKYAGVLMGITNCAGNIPGIIAPFIAKVIAKKPDHGNVRQVYQEEWREVFILAAEIFLFGAAMYVILADGKKQWWADGVKKRKAREVEEGTSEEKKPIFSKETIQYLPSESKS